MPAVSNAELRGRMQAMWHGTTSLRRMKGIMREGLVPGGKLSSSHELRPLRNAVYIMPVQPWIDDDYTREYFPVRKYAYFLGLDIDDVLRECNGHLVQSSNGTILCDMVIPPSCVTRVVRWSSVRKAWELIW